VLARLKIFCKFTFHVGGPEREIFFAIPPRHEPSAQHILAQFNVLVLKDGGVGGQIGLEQVLEVDAVELFLVEHIATYLVFLDLGCP